MKISKKKLKEEIFAFLDKHKLDEAWGHTAASSNASQRLSQARAARAAIDDDMKRSADAPPDGWALFSTQGRSTQREETTFWWVGRFENGKLVERTAGPFRDLSYASHKLQTLVGSG